MWPHSVPSLVQMPPYEFSGWLNQQTRFQLNGEFILKWNHNFHVKMRNINVFLHKDTLLMAIAHGNTPIKCTIHI